MATNTSKDAQTRAEANFKKRETQLREGAKAMAEYIAAGAAEREKTARLKLLREAKEAREAAAAAREAPQTKTRVAAKVEPRTDAREVELRGKRKALEPGKKAGRKAAARV